MNLEDRRILVSFLAVRGIGRGTVVKILRLSQQKQISLSEIWFSAVRRGLVPLTPVQEKNLAIFQKKFSPKMYAEYLANQQIQTFLSTDSNFPFLLKQTTQSPLVLFVKGQTHFWNCLPIAVVGTRHPTAYGESVTEAITLELVNRGATIVSGFMYGIDVLAHRTAIEHDGKSVAVLGYGFNYLYPRSQGHFLTEFLERGNVVMTEFSPETEPLAAHFPQRNRIVAGLSLAVLVTEASAKSGSLITAHYAAEYGRLVAAVPGPITSPFSDGTKKLINEGALFIAHGDEIVDELKFAEINAPKFFPFSADGNKTVEGQGTNSVQKSILECLKREAASPDQIFQKTHLPISAITAELSILEITGRIILSQGKWRLRQQ